MQQSSVPQHVAIILDGNRRWATARGMPKILGHTEGAKNVETIGLEAIRRGVTYLTLYTLSSENLKNRGAEELTHIFSLVVQLKDHVERFRKHSVRFNTIGDLSKLPQQVQDVLTSLKEESKAFGSLTLTIAINYGGRDEIVRAARKAVAGNLSSEDLTEESFSKLLDTAGMPDVDLLIRTGGHHRLSNFLPWQSTYAELYFTETMWPAFSVEEFGRALDWFAAQPRNHGK
jgi:undecaprenyl diphosphate synthase